MSVKELIFKCEDCGNSHNIKFYDEADLVFTHGCETLLVLNRGEAYLLMLYLQENLNHPTISKGLDEAIADELKNGPKSIMGREG